MFRSAGCAVVFWTSLLAARATTAEAWPSLDALASPRVLLIVHCRAEKFEDRVLYKVLDVWTGDYRPSAFVRQPPTGYINTLGPGSSGQDLKPGTEAILIYTRGNQPKEGIERYDMAIAIEDGKITYPPREVEPFSETREYAVEDFKREITSRIGKTKPGAIEAPPRWVNDYSGAWRMLLPGGHEHAATMEAAGENRYRLRSDGVRFNGVYEIRDGRFVAVEPPATRDEEHEWAIRSPHLLTLVKHVKNLQHDYRGAVLFRPRAGGIDRPLPAAADPDAAIRQAMEKQWWSLERRMWTIQYHEGMQNHSEWHIQGTMWRVRIYPDWYKLDELDKTAVYEIDAVALDQNYGVIDFYVYSRPKKLSANPRSRTLDGGASLAPGEELQPLITQVDSATRRSSIRIENTAGFRTLMPGEHFREYWNSLAERKKMQGVAADHLRRDQIESALVLEVNIAVAADPGSPGMEDELFGCLEGETRFHTGPLPELFDKPPAQKHLVAVFRSKNGDLGLITRYPKLTVIELQGYVGVIPDSR